MSQTLKSKRGTIATGIGLAIALIGVVWLVSLSFDSDEGIQSDMASRSPSVPGAAATATVAVAGDEPGAPGPLVAAPSTVLFDHDLGSGSVEFSGVTLNEDLNRMMVADDGDRLFEFDLDTDGLPIAPPRRTIEVAAGAGDIEGVAWMAGATYVLVNENDGSLSVVDIVEGLTVITNDNIIRTIETGIEEIDGSGLEGVAYVGAGDGDREFVVVDERPPTLYSIGRDGVRGPPVALDMDITDVSDIWVGPDGTYTAVSDETRVVVDFTVDDAGQVQVLNRLSLDNRDGRFEQPEGVARSADGQRLYVVGESPGWGQFSFGLWSDE